MGSIVPGVGAVPGAGRGRADPGDGSWEGGGGGEERAAWPLGSLRVRTQGRKQGKEMRKISQAG